MMIKFLVKFWWKYMKLGKDNFIIFKLFECLPCKQLLNLLVWNLQISLLQPWWNPFQNQCESVLQLEELWFLSVDENSLVNWEASWQKIINLNSPSLDFVSSSSEKVNQLQSFITSYNDLIQCTKKEINSWKLINTWSNWKSENQKPNQMIKR